MKKRSTYFAIALSILAGYFCYIQFSDMPSVNSDAENKEAAVVVVKPITLDIPEIVSTVAVLDPYEEVDIVNGTSGLLVELLYEPGLEVKAGSIVAKLTPEANVKASISGSIVDWVVKRGDYLDVGTIMGKIINDKQIIVEFTLPESYVNKVNTDQAFAIKVKAGGDKSHSGLITYVSPVVDRSTHQIKLRGIVNNSYRDLRAGMFAKIHLNVGLKKDVLLIPQASVFRQIDQSFIYKVDKGKIKNN